MVNEKRLIDANALRKVFINEECNCEMFPWAVDNAPTVDAVEVVHGRWEEWWPPKHMILTGEEMLYRCSACTAKYADISGLNYCPFCGARMDLQTEVTDEPDFI